MKEQVAVLKEQAQGEAGSIVMFLSNLSTAPVTRETLANVKAKKEEVQKDVADLRKVSKDVQKMLSDLHDKFMADMAALSPDTQDENKRLAMEKMMTHIRLAEDARKVTDMVAALEYGTIAFEALSIILESLISINEEGISNLPSNFTQNYVTKAISILKEGMNAVIFMREDAEKIVSATAEQLGNMIREITLESRKL